MEMISLKPITPKIHIHKANHNLDQPLNQAAQKPLVILPVSATLIDSETLPYLIIQIVLTNKPHLDRQD